MKFSKMLTAVLFAVVFVACNFTEEIYFNNDGSGKMSMRFDGGEMLQMLPSTDSTALEKAVDSTIVFKDVLWDKKDSIATLTPEKQAKLKKLEPFKLHMQVDAERGIMNFDLFRDFKKVAEINDAFNTFQNASSVGPIAGGKSMPGNVSEESTRVDYTFKNNRFKRETIVLDQALFEKSIDSLVSAEMFLSSSTYTFRYHFPKRVKWTNINEATFSMDGKTMVHEVSFLDMMKNPESMIIEVDLEK
ncbi:hypothetical protein Q2T41_05615 [Maribacter confluentis]|uniref:Lipoprotein n=1 Tax=Maribacter confluentis TaxID=1656093 RepID=A0ABT8RMW7_9FLAO|nr:hypothetical protein [Maribacter confluentis]MDO1512130.1 hypothetical protein [Maribacter confluentis]